MGLDIGLEKTGRFTFIGCVEKEHSFCETIRANQRKGNLPPSLKVFEGDIRGFSVEEVLEGIDKGPGEVDILVGGPPCQSFSTAGRRGTVKDPRGTLLWDFLRFIKGIQPRFFLMENVRGLLSAAVQHRPIALRPKYGGKPLGPDEEPGSAIRLFAKDLQKMNGRSYRVDAFKVNAVNYGAPQIRERVLFFGNRYNATVTFPEPTHGPPVVPGNGQTSLSIGETQSSLKSWRTLGDAIGDLAEKDRVIMDFSERKKKYLMKVPPGSNWRSLPIEEQIESMGRAYVATGGRSGWWRRLSYDLPCPTLMTMPNHASTSLCHPAQVRALSLREFARIQEFPDEWDFIGSIGEQYAQVGNAVPIRLGEVAGDVLVAELDTLVKRGWEKYAPPDKMFDVNNIQSHVRTRQWYRAGKTVIREDGAADSERRAADSVPPAAGP